MGVIVLWAFGREALAASPAAIRAPHTERRAVTCEIEVPVRLALD
jgi:hypothetical protein